MGKVVVIGSGFAGLSAACFMAKAGLDVKVLEKHAGPGGRARQLKEDGFCFDMGPSWYWMPDVFDRFFAAFGKKTADYYQLQRLSPSYTVYGEDGPLHIPSDYNELKALFEQLETGSGERLDQYLLAAGHKYKIGMQQLAYKPGQHLSEFVNKDLLTSLFRMDLFTDMTRHIARYFKHPVLQQLLAFPVLFLGALPENIPALYSFMNYADIKLGTWYPQGGMYGIVDGMYSLAKELGVTFHFNEEVSRIELEKGRAVAVQTASSRYEADTVVGAADYHFIETELLPASHRSYSAAYWDRRVMAPSCLLYYVGLNKRLPALHHHSLFFDVPFDAHGAEIYSDPKWPANPLFYVSCPSRTDDTVAPEGHENLFILIPVAAGLTGDNEVLRKQYFDMVIKRLETHLQETVADKVVYMKSYAGRDFTQDYHAFKGNAYGLANTLKQTALLKPSMRSRKVSNLFYAGQLTVPGPGVPPSIISGEIAATAVLKSQKLN
jgi:phytoene desaturase